MPSQKAIHGASQHIYENGFVKWQLLRFLWGGVRQANGRVVAYGPCPGNHFACVQASIRDRRQFDVTIKTEYRAAPPFFKTHTGNWPKAQNLSGVWGTFPRRNSLQTDKPETLRAVFTVHFSWGRPENPLLLPRAGRLLLLLPEAETLMEFFGFRQEGVCFREIRQV